MKSLSSHTHTILIHVLSQSDTSSVQIIKFSSFHFVEIFLLTI